MTKTDIIKAPLLTEKSTSEMENNNRYCFQVAVKANKYQIKAAVEELFNVKVEKIWTSILPGKQRRFGRNVVKSSKSKKAFIQLAEGQKIELFKGI